VSESIKTLKNIIDEHGNTYEANSNLSALYLQLGQNEIALQYCNKAIKLDPYSYVAYFNRFLIRYTLDEHSDAWKDLKKALSCLNMIRGN
jgi:tetratricopeptide (TPR) repeat protein